ncbi:MAG: flagellar assembly protein FliW [Elusimicrobiota bacterium]
MMTKTESPLSIEPTLNTSRFGQVKIITDNVLTFPEGLVGFSDFKRYILLEHGDSQGIFYWLQSMDDMSLAFPVVNPAPFNQNYKIKISIPDLSSIELTDEKDAQVLAIATIPIGDEKKMWLNLQAPLIINKMKKCGKQVILDGTHHPLRFQVTF